MNSENVSGGRLEQSAREEVHSTVMRSNILSSAGQDGQNGAAHDDQLSPRQRRVHGHGHTRANRRWWDDQAAQYYLEHGEFLGDTDLVWGPEGCREEDLRVFGDPGSLAGLDVLEIGAGAAQGARWVAAQGVRVVASDLSSGMLNTARTLNGRHHSPLPLVQCDGTGLPFASASFDLVFTAYGVVPFVADSRAVMHEAARVLRPGGRFAFSTTHPIRWAFPDTPGPEGLRADRSYFDRTPYAEYDRSGRALYAEHHRTLGDRVRELTEAGLVLERLIEPEWPESNTDVWGGWSPTRGRILPGTAIFLARRYEDHRRNA